MENELLIKYLSTGDFPLQFRMENELPLDLENKISKCKELLYSNGVISEALATQFVLSLNV